MSQTTGANGMGLVRSAMLMAALLVTACLPDSDGLSEKRLAEFAQNEAKSYAASFSTFTSQSQKILSKNAAFQDGSLPQGLVGRSSDRTMSYGYCADGANHMIVSWMNTTAPTGSFGIKGLGEGAGSVIVDALGQFSTPETIGYFNNNAVELRGPRDNGLSRLQLPATCALAIPPGAPVMLVENMAAPNAAMDTVNSYVYKTVNCPDGQIGFMTKSCKKTSATSCNPENDAGWDPVGKGGCNEKVSERTVTISSNSNSLIGALDLSRSGNNIEKALNNLSDAKCMNVKRTEKVKDRTGKLVDKEIEMADSCDTANIKITKYDGPEQTEVTNKIERTETVEASCGGEAPDTVAGSLAFNGKRYTGNLTFAEWTGKSVYMRHIYKAVAETNDAGKKHGETTQRGPWFGGTLACTRAETFVIACNKLFPQYNDSVRYEIVSGAGVTFRRTNRVNGWKDADKMIPNDSLSRDQNWTMSTVNCVWDEVRTFDCPQHRLKQLGINKRRITATKNNFSQPTVAAWRKVTQLKCEKTKTDTKSCPG